MHAIFHTILAQTPPEGYPERVETPRYFLQVLNNPFCLWFFRIVLAAAFLLLIFGIWYYGRRAQKEELPLAEEKGEKE